MSQAPKQFMFVAHRDVSFVSTKGYAFNFKKGVPQHAPKAVHAELIEKGILPADEKGDVQLDEVDRLAQESDPKVKIVLAPETHEERADAIRKVCLAVAERNRADDFTAGGVPSAAAVSQALGWKVDLKEIRPVWLEIKQALNQG